MDLKPFILLKCVLFIYFLIRKSFLFLNNNTRYVQIIKIFIYCLYHTAEDLQ